MSLLSLPRLAAVALVAASAACSAGAPPVTAPEPVAAPAPVLPPLGTHVPASAVLVPASLASVGMDSGLAARVDGIVRTAIAEGAAPGATVAIGRYGRIVHLQGYGALEYAPDAAPAAPTSLYDLASLTKVIATTTVAMELEEAGRLDIDHTVASYLPEFNAPDKAAITVRMLLTHSGGLEAYAPLYHTVRGRSAYLTAINERPLAYAPGSKAIYSDWDMVLMQAVIERITGFPLDEYAANHVFGPLGMTDTRFTPDTTDAALRRRIAPTAVDPNRGGLLRGTVHDGNAWALGGVSGHAGLFSTARDLAIFSQFMLNGGSYGGYRLLSPQTVARWTARQGPDGSRALGWDTPAPQSSAGRYFSPRAFGHTGFTGTSLWVDPERGLFVVLLMNRVNTRGDATRHVQLRRDLADAVQSAVLDAPLVPWEKMP